MVKIMKVRTLAVLVFLLLFSVSYAKPHSIYQYSVLNSLMSGVYDGGGTISGLLEHGDFGIGTVNGLDGELVITGGQAYQVRSDGTVIVLDGGTKVPFAQVCFFDPQKSFMISGPISLEAAKALIDSRLGSKNVFYAVKMKGVFSYIKARSVPKQSKPYPLFAEAVKKQSLFEFVTAEGQVIGFRQPDYIKEINTPGYHFHFLDKDAMSGGHILDLRILSAEAYVDKIHEYTVEFPNDEEFMKKDLSGDNQYKP